MRFAHTDTFEAADAAGNTITIYEYTPISDFKPVSGERSAIKGHPRYEAPGAAIQENTDGSFTNVLTGTTYRRI